MAFDPTFPSFLYCRWHGLQRSLQRLPASTSNWHQKKSHVIGYVAWLKVPRVVGFGHPKKKIMGRRKCGASYQHISHSLVLKMAIFPKGKCFGIFNHRSQSLRQDSSVLRLQIFPQGSLKRVQTVLQKPSLEGSPNFLQDYPKVLAFQKFGWLRQFVPHEVLLTGFP